MTRQAVIQQSPVLRELRPRLEQAFGDRLRGVVLYGSRARGDATEDSDYDVLVLLSGPVHLSRDLRQTIQAIYPLQLEIEQAIHASPVAVEEFEAGEFGLYRNAKSEGVFL